MESGALMFVSPSDYMCIMQWFKKAGICIKKDHMVLTDATLKLLKQVIKS